MSTAQMVQLNLRVDAQDKAQAAEVLCLMGLTVSDFVRMALAKVARGAKDCEEALALFDAPAESAAVSEEKPLSPALAERDVLVSHFCSLLGYDKPAEVPIDDRPWEELYEEARLEHFREKGYQL